MKRCLAACIAAGLLPLALPCAALPDPTLPPPAWRTAASGVAPDAPAAQPARPQLQGLRLGPRPSALIDGQLMQPGQRLNGYLLLRIDTEAAVLRDAEGRQHRLLLLPQDDKNNTRKEARP
ncbi:hypothetical protein [Inhella sp.]|uniref:hypothetical protein n=1 Tax=Inhella sp. TaxID=1921806 RepID=UPI0035B235B6